MNKFNLSGALVRTAFLFVAVLLSACVNEEYDLSEENINLEVTPFQEGLTLPLGSTEQIKLQDLLKDVEIDLLKVGENGVYSLNYSDAIDVSDNLGELKDLVNLPKIDFSQNINFRFADADLSDMTIDEQKFLYEFDLSSAVSSKPDMTIKPFGITFDMAAGLPSYAPSANEMSLSLQTINETNTLMELPEDFHIDPLLVNKEPISLDNYMDKFDVTPVVSQNEAINLDITLPKGIKSVGEVRLTEGSAIKITTELSRSFITSGQIIPVIDVDLSEVFHLAGEVEDDVVHLAESMVLSEDNKYKASQTVYLSSLALAEGSWVLDDEKGALVLRKTLNVPVSGRIEYEGLMTTTELLETRRGIDVNMIVEFLNIKVADMEVAIDDVGMSYNENVAFSNSFTLPKEIRDVRNVTFKDGSGLSLNITAQNLEKISGLSATLEKLSVSFPAAMDIAGNYTTDKDGYKVVTFSNVDLASGLHEYVDIKGIDLPAPQNGNVSIDELIKVEAVAVAGGTVHTKELPKLKADDVNIHIDVTANIEIADYEVEIDELSYDVDAGSEEIKVEVPDDIAGMGSIYVYPKEKASISLEVIVPEIGLNIVPKDGGVVIKFPEMLRFGSLPGEYNYNEASHSIVLNKPLAEIGTIELPIEKILIDPVKDEADGRYYVKGKVQINGKLGLDSNFLNKEQVDNLAGGGDRKITVGTLISEFVPADIDLERFSTDINEEVELALLSADDLPKELVSLGVVELDKTDIDIALDMSSFPDRGENSYLDLDLNVTFPKMIKVEGADENGVYKVKLKSSAKVFEFEPIKVNSLDFTGLDLKKGIKDVIKVDGKIMLGNASINIDEWLGKDLSAKFKANIEKIDISKITGKVDYQVDPINQSVDLSEFAGTLAENGIEAKLDFSHAHIALEINTNLSVPVGASLEILPIYDGEPDLTKKIEAALSLEMAESAEKPAVTRYWLSESEDRMPAGYTFVKVDVAGLLKQIPEKLEINLVAGTDKTKDCVLEPKKDYTLTADYMLEVPLEFGDEFEIVYRDTIPDMPEIVGALLAKGNKVALGGEIINSLPLGLDLELNFLDSDNNVVPSAQGCGKLQVSPCKLDGSASTTKIEVVVGLKGGVDASDIASLEIVLNANSGGITGVPAKETSYLQANLQVILPEGVTVDLKDFIETEDEQ